MAKFYAVQIGRKPGVYFTWDECKAQVIGYPKSLYKSFSTLKEAEEYVKGSVKVDQTESKASTVIYTDGSFSSITNSAGWACYHSLTHEVIYGSLPGKQTNNRAELFAILSAVKFFPGDLLIYTDSNYCVNILKGHWKASENLDLYQSFKELIKDRCIELQHVYGHNRDSDLQHREPNEIVDYYAKEGAKISDKEQRSLILDK